VSSAQLLSARLGRPWRDWRLCSAHGADVDAVAAVSGGEAAFFLTGTQSPAALCGQLAAAGLGNLPVVIGENLGGVDEKITRTAARAAADGEFSPLSVLLAEPAPMPYPRRAPGIPDADFLRGNVPMTKQEVRAAVVAKLAVCPGDTVWDVGAGTGAVSVELSRAARRGRVYAVEHDAEACQLIRRNREKFGAWNLTLIQGDAPDVLESLPTPDAVFIGGSGGALESVIETALRKNASARLCVSAVTLETLSAAVTAFAVRGLDAEACQIAVSRTRPVGKLHLLAAQNPVFLITAQNKNGGSAETSEAAKGGGV
jgi:precorrin-6Y C5,15-methyltransferase (decarboxylating)